MTTANRLPDGIDPTRAEFKKSQYSDNAGNGDCVEVSGTYHESHGVVLVRDSKDKAGPVLCFSDQAWARFATAAADGEFGEARA